jgi:hypothetical protein
LGVCPSYARVRRSCEKRLTDCQWSEARKIYESILKHALKLSTLAIGVLWIVEHAFSYSGRRRVQHRASWTNGRVAKAVSTIPRSSVAATRGVTMTRQRSAYRIRRDLYNDCSVAVVRAPLRSLPFRVVKTRTSPSLSPEVLRSPLSPVQPTNIILKNKIYSP